MCESDFDFVRISWHAFWPREEEVISRAHGLSFSLTNAFNENRFHYGLKHCLSLKVIVLCGCLPFTTNSRKFLLGCKWQTFFWFVPLENFPGQINGNSEQVVPFSQLGRSAWKFVYSQTNFLLGVFRFPSFGNFHGKVNRLMNVFHLKLVRS